VTHPPDATVRAVLFDWGDTLVRYPGFSTDEGGHRHAVEACFHWLAEGPEAACFERNSLDVTGFAEAYRHAAVAQFAEMARTRVDQSMAERLGDTLRRTGCRCELPLPLLERYLDRLLDELAVRCTAMPDVLSVLEKLSPQFRLGVVSNFPEPRFVHATLDRFALRRYFEVVVVSAEVGRMKPDPLPFELAFAALDVEPSAVLFVGDDLRADMAGAAALGCMTAWIPLDPTAELPAGASVTHRLSGLVDLLPLLGG